MPFDLTTILGCSVHDDRLRELREFFEEYPQSTERESELGGRYYLEFHCSGFSLLLTGGDLIQTVHIHPRSHGKYRPFADQLPSGLTPNTTQAHARELLGPPSRCGGPVRPVLVSMPVVYWDRWDYERHLFHLEYPETRDSISLITLSFVQTPTTNEPGNI